MSIAAQWTVIIIAAWLASLWYAYTLGKMRGECLGLKEARKAWREAREALRI